MKRVLLPIVVIGLLLLSACGGSGTEQPPSPSESLANTPDELEAMISSSMTLDQVYASMSNKLKNRVLSFPAQNIQQSDGQWMLTAKEGAYPGDRDAPYVVLFCLTQGENDGYYIIFFHNELLIEDGWYDDAAQTRMMKLLWKTEASESEQTLPPATPQESEPTPSIPQAESGTFEPITISGSGSKTSSPFTVTTDEWVIDWSYEIDPEYEDFGAAFSFFIYPRGETEVYVEAILLPDETSGSTYSYAGAGEYYLKVIAAGITSWEIIIQPPQQ